MCLKCKLPLYTETTKKHEAKGLYYEGRQPAALGQAKSYY